MSMKRQTRCWQMPGTIWYTFQGTPELEGIWMWIYPTGRQAFPAKFCQTNRQVDVVVPGKTWQRFCGPSGKMAQSMAFVGAARC